MNRAPLRETIRRIEQEWDETALTPPASPVQMRGLYAGIAALPEDARRAFLTDLSGSPVASVTTTEDGQTCYTWTPNRTPR